VGCTVKIRAGKLTAEKEKQIRTLISELFSTSSGSAD
jgi:ParB family chromosome partitioning protein